MRNPYFNFSASKPNSPRLFSNEFQECTRYNPNYIAKTEEIRRMKSEYTASKREALELAAQPGSSVDINEYKLKFGLSDRSKVQYVQNTKNEGQYYQQSPPVQHSNSYLMAMRALQTRIREMETQMLQNHDDNTAKNILGILENLELNKQRLETNSKKEHPSLEKNQTNERQKILMDQNKVLMDEINHKELKVQELQIQLSQFHQTKQQEIEELAQIVEQLTDKLNEEKQNTQDQISINQKLQDQLIKNMEYEKEMKAIQQSQQLEEMQKQKQIITDQLSKINFLEQQVKRLEKQFKDVTQQKASLEQEFQEYKLICPQYKYSEQQKTIQSLESELREKENAFQSQIDDVLKQKRSQEQELNLRIQQLMQANSDHQQQLYQMSMEFQELTIKQLPQYVECKSDRKSINSKIDRQSRSGQESQTAPNSIVVSPRFYKNKEEERKVQKQSINLPDLQKVIRQCFDDLNKRDSQSCIEDIQQTATFHDEFPEQTSRRKLSLQKQTTTNPLRKNIISLKNSPLKNEKDQENTQRLLQLDLQQRELNEKYEILHRQAQNENDYKIKALIRHELLELTDQIKMVNQELLILQVNKRKNFEL